MSAERMSDERLAEIQALAVRAEADSPSPWVPYFTVHGDPYVNLSPGRGLTSIGIGTVASVSTGSDDYGKSTAEFIAAADPSTVLALVAEVAWLRQIEEAATAWSAAFDEKAQTLADWQAERLSGITSNTPAYEAMNEGYSRFVAASDALRAALPEAPQDQT